MADTTNTTAPQIPLLDGLAAALSIWQHRVSRSDRIERLQRKSDAELARMGLDRDDIPRHVYRDRFPF